MSHSQSEPKPALARGVALLRDPLLNKGTAFTESERVALGLKGLLPPHVFTLEEQVGASAGELPPQAERPRALHLSREPAGSQRDALLSRGDRIPGSNDAHHLHAHGWAGLPAVRSPLPAHARSVHLLCGPGQRRGEPPQLAAEGRARHRRHRRRAHPRPGRSGRGRHGHPGRQALALHGLRWHPSGARACR